ncbi:hypothetical protein P0S91_20125 [Gloeocapsopsis dulcis]|nr:hypothetical protein [Gloeocapsopsis dulcis]WNN88567.1 hypothetical protein P0S91_20125 [Gloeocapsopsis dulcis]
MTVTAKSTHVFYSDIPAPLGKIVAEYRIAPGCAIAYSVKAGQYYASLKSLVLTLLLRCNTQHTGKRKAYNGLLTCPGK